MSWAAEALQRRFSDIQTGLQHHHDYVGKVARSPQYVLVVWFGRSYNQWEADLIKHYMRGGGELGT